MYIWWTAYKGKGIIIKWGIDKYIEINGGFSDVPIKNDIGWLDELPWEIQINLFLCSFNPYDINVLRYIKKI